MDFKLTIYNLSADTNPLTLAEGIIENYNEDWDGLTVAVEASEAEGERVTVIAKDVAKGDMKLLREDIYRDFGDEDEFMLVRLSESKDGAHWFEVNLEDDE